MSSHVDLMKFVHEKFNKKGPDYVVVMEDDIVLKQDSIEKLDTVISGAPSDWEILQLHHVRLNCVRSKPTYDNVVNGLWVPWKRGYFSTALYVVRRSALKKLLDIFYDKSKDMFDYSKLRSPVQADNVIYACCKTYTSTHNFGMTNTSFNSNIQKSRTKALIIRRFERTSERMYRLVV